MATQEAEDLDGLSRSEVLRASPRMFESDLLDRLSPFVRVCDETDRCQGLSRV